MWRPAARRRLSRRASAAVAPIAVTSTTALPASESRRGDGRKRGESERIVRRDQGSDSRRRGLDAEDENVRVQLPELRSDSSRTMTPMEIIAMTEPNPITMPIRASRLLVAIIPRPRRRYPLPPYSGPKAKRRTVAARVAISGLDKQVSMPLTDSAFSPSVGRCFQGETDHDA